MAVQNKGVTRRSFVAAASIGSAALLAGGAQVASADEAQEEQGFLADGIYPAGEEVVPEETYDYDVVICGTGAAGITAAVHAGELGVNAVVVEPLAECAVGGCGNHAEGMGVYWNDDEQGSIAASIPFSDVQYEKGAKSIDEIVANVLDYHKNMCNASLLRTTLERSVDMYWWMTGHGVVWEEPTTPTQKYAGSGTQCNNTLYQEALALGVPFMWSVSGERLIMKDGRVAGILCKRQNGAWLQINCKAVIMCTGGYLASKELFEKYTFFHYDNFLMYGSVGTEKGVAYTMGEAIGAGMHHPDNVMYCGPIIPGHYNKSKLTCTCANDGLNIWVNEFGERWIDESNANDWSQSSAAGGQWHLIASIFDDASIDYMEQVGPTTGRGHYVKRDEPCPGVRAEVEAALEAGDANVFKADTIQELAEMIGIDPDGLAATIEEYNGFCETGVDTKFAKAEKFLKCPCATPPFYGIKMIVGAYTCAGGLKVDKFMHVLNKYDYQPIPGFYAAGGDAGGLQGAVYDRKVFSGSSQVWSRTGGFYAIEDIANVYLPSLA